METAATTAVDAGATTIDGLHSDILTQILRRLDGATLATVGCASSGLRSLATDPYLWQNLCLSSWPSLYHPCLLDIIPSFPNCHRSFFSDAYPFPPASATLKPIGDDQLPEFISAVDVRHKGEVIVSKVIETESESPWFLGSPFRIDALDRKDRPPPEQPPKATTISPEDLTLSWIIIDPSCHRAVNVSSWRPVSMDRHWYTGETQVRFATVLGNGVAAATVVVTCSSETKQVTEVALTVEDEDGLCLNGKESLVVLQGVLEGERKGSGMEGEAGVLEVKERYWEYECRKKERKEKMVRWEGRIDMLFVLAGVFLFLGFMAWMALL